MNIPPQAASLNTSATPAQPRHQSKWTAAEDGLIIEWDEEKENKLARLYERFKAEMWSKIAEEMGIPWRAVEAMHWKLGEKNMAERAASKRETESQLPKLESATQSTASGLPSITSLIAGIPSGTPNPYANATG